MAARRHIALLRGINVGGNNIIPMADLRACFEAMGFSDVATYIQSGNVVFISRSADRMKLTTKIEKGLSRAFSYSSRVAIISDSEMADVIRQAPAGFGTEPETYRHDVLFPLHPITAAAAVAGIPVNPDVDVVAAGKHALYFRRVKALAASSQLDRLASLPLYRQLTVRNWNTTTRLAEMARG